MNRLNQRLLVLAFCLIPAFSAADERILEYRSDIQVLENGQLTVREFIRVNSEGRNIKRGIYRDFPTDYTDRLGNHVNVDFVPLTVNRNGHTEAWHTQGQSNGVRLYAGSADHQLSPGIHEYELVFMTNRQLGFFPGHDELYFNAVGNGWVFPIDRVIVTVTLPFDVAAEQLSLDVYTGAYGLKGSDAIAEVLNEHTVRFESKRGFQPGEGLTIAVAWPKGLIAEPDLRQKTSWFLHDNGAALALLLGLLATLAWFLWAWNKVGRDPGKGVIIPRFQAPRGLSPAACRYVKDMAFSSKSFTAAIVSLAVKGQLLIEEDEKDFTLKRLPEAPEASLTKGERAVLNALLPGRSSTIEMDNENHKVFQQARQELKKALKSEYLGRLFHLNSIYLAPAILMLVAAAFIAAFYNGGQALWISYLVLSMALLGLFSFLMRAPTPAGRIVMDEIEGFKSYLGTAEQDRLEIMHSPDLTPEVFEEFLPYAYALGVENNWCQRFALAIPAEVRQQTGYHPGWYNGRYSGVRALNHLGSNFSSSFSSAISSASSPPGSSSGSGGGGSSGGGGGGGGGGGW